jgi:hypothetical protein
VSTKIIETLRGKDGKRYPVGLPLPRGDRIKIILRLHELCHGLGYSQREAQAILLAEGWRRSTGSIHNDLERPMCPACRAAGGG